MRRDRRPAATVPSALGHAWSEYRASWKTSAGGRDLAILTSSFLLIFIIAWLALSLSEGLRDRLVEAMTGRFGEDHFPVELIDSTGQGFHPSLWPTLADQQRFAAAARFVAPPPDQPDVVEARRNDLAARLADLGTGWPTAQLDFADLGLASLEAFGMPPFGVADEETRRVIALDRADPMWRWMADRAGFRGEAAEPGTLALVMNLSAVDWFDLDAYLAFLRESAPAQVTRSLPPAVTDITLARDTRLAALTVLYLPWAARDSGYTELVPAPVFWVHSLPLRRQVAALAPADAAGLTHMAAMNRSIRYYSDDRGRGVIPRMRAVAIWPLGDAPDAVDAARHMYECLRPPASPEPFDASNGTVRYGDSLTVPESLIETCRTDLDPDARALVLVDPVGDIDMPSRLRAGNGLVFEAPCDWLDSIGRPAFRCSPADDGREWGLAALPQNFERPPTMHLYAGSRSELFQAFDLMKRFGSGEEGGLLAVERTTRIAGERLKFLMGVMDWTVDALFVGLFVVTLAMSLVQLSSLLQHKADALLVLHAAGLPPWWIHLKTAIGVGWAWLIGSIAAAMLSIAGIVIGNNIFAATDLADAGERSIGLSRFDVFQVPDVGLIVAVWLCGFGLALAALGLVVRGSQGRLAGPLEPIRLMQ